MTHRQPQNDRLRFAVVGAGVIGNHHGKVIERSWPTRSS